ncbi:hypothetical protein GLAREA_11993 [Glarea lozoyensis ATCC 20868]|uniref:Heterokaryon incompatibility domain-containing protein n=1 Tax=Glarea lozoyensis (strain ATCC 20868 / MF5171) TaxID=1116229 RepID=S3DIQ4_GLAL2|nr:uncharacterized protein GLAREA_11993 [Glarea lozoyensis ATCC 20868]EPE31911.1 hypothetical protein GLAREA_11993 [Glarea lozoyensis ATCC 20868]
MGLYRHLTLGFRDSIRVVKIDPAKDQTEWIQLSIFQVRLRDRPKYEALSYEWGAEMCDKSVICDGQELQVKINLAAALKHLRLSDEPRWMWIDAICIDQENIPERNQQVSIMRDVYAQADRVLIWIGEEFPYVKDAFKMIPELAKNWQIREVARLQAGDSRPPLRLRPSIAEEPSLMLQNELLWKSLYKLFASTYFERTWILQEIVVSTRATVVCGKQQVDWKLFNWAASFINATTSLLQNAPDTDTLTKVSGIDQIRSMYKQRGGFPLPLYLVFVQVLKSTNPRDKIYAILGLRRDGIKELSALAELLRVDYTKSEQQVYQDAARYIIESQQRLDICCGQPLTSKGVEDLPSWVPDWSARMEGAPSTFLTACSHYRLHNLLPWPGIITFNHNSMYTDGLSIDSIAFATGTLSCETPLPAIKQIILHLCSQLGVAPTRQVDPGLASLASIRYRESVSPTDGQSIFEALWRTLIGNTAYFKPAQPTFARHFEGLLDIIRLRERGIIFDRTNINEITVLEPDVGQKFESDIFSQLLWRSAVEKDTHPFFAELVNTIQGRVFFTTSKGYMGFGAMGSKIGDQVCVLRGGSCPFILRSHDTYFEMIGDSYLHGIMQGRILDRPRPKRQRFRIC